MNACEIDITLTTFCKAPFSSAIIELHDVWANIDSLKRILCALAEHRPHLFQKLMDSERQAVTAVHMLKLPEHVFCYGFRALLTAFNWPMPMDVLQTRDTSGYTMGVLPYPSRAQLRYVQQRLMALRAFTAYMDPVYIHLFPNYMHAFTLDKLESRAKLVKKEEMDRSAAVQ